MSPAVLRVVLLVSCAHAMVHVYELALPSVEQRIGGEYAGGGEPIAHWIARASDFFGVPFDDKRITGLLSTVWRIPFGYGAFFAGWLADRFGSKPMLVIYLSGCAVSAAAAYWAPSLTVLFAVMFLMGCFASIYHPAGLAIISREAPLAARSHALGWHGIFGSLGIAAAPFLAGLVTDTAGLSWRQFYLLLALPGAALAAALAGVLREEPPAPAPTHRSRSAHDDVSAVAWTPYALLVTVGMLNGLIYAAVMSFLRRYLSETDARLESVEVRDLAGYGAAMVLLCGVVGQALAGRWARPARLVPLLIAIALANAPCLAWMAAAQGWGRLAAACAFGLVHFMHQPVYNSLVAAYTPRHRRSLGFGFSNMVCFGIGGLGPAVAGFMPSDAANYLALAGLAVAAAMVSALLLTRPRGDSIVSRR